MAWALDEDDAYSDSVLGLLVDGEALVPAVWPLEAANTILTAVRSGRLTEAEGARVKTLVEAMPIVVVPETPRRVFAEIFSLGRQWGLSSYDASYLDLAMREGIPLATVDTRLRRAARSAGVRILPSSARGR